MEIVVSGKKTWVPGDLTIDRLLQHFNISKDERGIAVAKNDEIVFKREWPSKHIDEGDKIEIVRATQGG